MRLLEQLQFMRQIGIEESEESLTHRLKKVGYNMERAISDYFENIPVVQNIPISKNTFENNNSNRNDSNSSKKKRTATSVTTDSFSNSDTPLIKQPQHEFSLLSPQRSSSTTRAAIVNSSPNILFSPHCNVSVWLIGRRVTLGYTLNSGYALREIPLLLKLEGILRETGTHIPKSKMTPSLRSVSSYQVIGSGSSATAIGKKRLTKFSAANMLFECEQLPAVGQSRGVEVLRGRFSNLICNFLVPLLQHDMIVVTGHIAYDCGPVGVFQDLPLSLQIMVTKTFFDIMSRDVGATASSNMTDSSAAGSTGDVTTGSQSRESLKSVIKAGNEMLIWLSEGEEALLAARGADKKLADYTESLPTPHDNEDDGGGLTAGQEDHESEDGGSRGSGEVMTEITAAYSVSEAVQPRLMKDIQMKKYQLQALHWMQERERDNSVVPSEGLSVPYSDFSSKSATLTLPIEGVLESNDLTAPSTPLCHEKEERDSSDASSLWTPLCGLTVTFPSPSSSHGDSHQNLFCACNPEVNFYTSESIARAIQRAAPSPAVLSLWWNRYTQTVRTIPPPRSVPCRGGILADQMGLGKTIMAISLIVSELDEDTVSFTQLSGAGNVSSVRDPGARRMFQRRRTLKGSTLIVCPLSLVSQWLEEFKAFVVSGALRVAMYYGADRDNDICGGSNVSMGSADVVITSYGVLTSEWRRMISVSSGSVNTKKAQEVNKGCVLLGKVWRRVIIDEGHIIRNPQTDTAQACYQLEAESRWILSGTPIQNKIDDLYSLMKFLRHQPWDSWKWWYTTISQPIHLANECTKLGKRPRSSESHGSNSASTSNEASEGIVVVRKLMSTLMLRRTKETVDIETGTCIVTLPPREILYVYIDLTPAERSFYAALAKRSNSQMLSILTRQQQQHVAGGAGTSTSKIKSSLSGYAELFTLLMRLRQTCDHPVLVLNSLLEKQSLKNLLNGISNEQKSIQESVVATAGSALTHDSDSIVNDDDDCCKKVKTNKMNVLNRVKDKFLSGGTDYNAGSTLFLNDVLKSLEKSWLSGGVTATLDDVATQAFEQQECCICFEYLVSADDTAITPCGHILCWECGAEAIERSGTCPLCVRPMNRSELIPLGDTVKKEIDVIDISEEVQSGTKSETSSIRSFFNKKDSNRSGASYRAIASSSSNTDKPASDILKSINWQMSSKLTALQRHLEEIFLAPTFSSSISETVSSLNRDSEHVVEPNSPIKVVIFSQWMGMLDLVDTMIRAVLIPQQDISEKERNSGSSFDRDAFSSVTAVADSKGPISGKGVNYFSTVRSDKVPSSGLRPNCTIRFDGSMSQAQRSSALHRFAHDASARVLLISLKAGGVGLNLTAASYLFLLDPWWNPAVEDQAIDRVHRLGQRRNVKIFRMVCRDTVEEKLIALQASKRHMSQQAISCTPSVQHASVGGASTSSNKLSLEELKGLFL